MMGRTEKSMILLAAGGLALWYLTRKKKSDGYSFAGKTVFITGGSRGLGLVLARELAREGARIAICARDEGELERAADDIGESGMRPIVAVADVIDASQVREAVAQIEGELGPIEVLINNAGIIAMGPLANMTRHDFEEALEVSFWGAYNTVEAVLPGMRTRREGRIVNISSIGGKISVPHLAPYCVGKFALAGYSNALRVELAADGIVVTTVCPGLMRTGSPRNALFKGRQSAEYAWFKTGGSLPLLTVSAEHAAHEIVEAVRHGDAELVISLPAKIATMVGALFPETMADLISLANRLLPLESADGVAMPGKECELPSALSALTVLTDKAAVQNNEVNPMELEP
jgi:NAD(P)-dependent dehydrogenase (short-subunit alcohol dehydrogenase family)